LDGSSCSSNSASAVTSNISSIIPQQNLRDSFDLDCNSLRHDNNYDEYQDEENSFHDDNYSNIQTALNSQIWGGQLESKSYDPDEMQLCPNEYASYGSGELYNSKIVKSGNSHSSTPSTSMKRTRGRPHSDRINSYHNTKHGTYSYHAPKTFNKDRYKPQRNLSYPSLNMQQDDSLYNLYHTANHNPKAISWRQASAPADNA
jgi:hypothetical protein